MLKGPLSCLRSDLQSQACTARKHFLRGLAMRVIEVSSTRDALARLLGDMRQWLDRNDWAPVAGFQTERNGDSIQIKVQFNDNALAERFRLAFRGSYAA